jgi:hypothetical protein
MEATFAGALTNRQAEIANRIGDIYRRWHRAKRLRVSPKSPQLEGGFGGADLAEERMSGDQLEAFEASVRAAQEAWEALDGAQGLFRSLRRTVRAALVALCVEDKAIGPIELVDVRGVLDHLALRWPEARGGRGCPSRSS